MLQSSVFPHLARLKVCFLHSLQRQQVSKITKANDLGPMDTLTEAASEEIEHLKYFGNHWVFRGRRSIAVAVSLLQKDEIIAVPTDTIYGLAGLVSSTESITKLYEIKNRDENKPLSISLANVRHVEKWAEVAHISLTLLTEILPGPYTIILKRKPALNPALNPNYDTVGIRVPANKFITNISKVVGPIALTSANLSSEPSCLYASQFKHLWPKLGGIFHDGDRFGKATDKLEKGSTIVDLSEPECYKIVRKGVGHNYLLMLLRSHGLKQISDA